MDFAQLPAPPRVSAWLDMDALDHNIKLVNQKTQAVKLRIATKSIRSMDVLRYIQKHTPHFIGLMSYSAAESVYLLQNGFDNILCAYPTLDRASVAEALKYNQQGATMIWMADRIEHLHLLNEIGKQQEQSVEVCLDINMSMPLPKLYFGTKRSALMRKSDVKTLIEQAGSLSHITITAMMGYEAQIAGLAEHLPGKSLITPAIKLLKNSSKRQVSRRRASMVHWINKQGYPLKLVNGGGSGSMDFTSSQPEVTEITVGSAYYKPAYFDYMDSMQQFKPAAGFVLPVTRQPEKRVITCQGGGFIASGAIGTDKVPVVHYPPGLSLLTDEGFGEVQTPFAVDEAVIKQGNMPTIGEAVWCRHAKAGELAEHFNELVCYRGNKPLIVEGAAQVMTTYRGEGLCFH